jgi:hypothetical protein
MPLCTAELMCARLTNPFIQYVASRLYDDSSAESDSTVNIDSAAANMFSVDDETAFVLD